MSDDENELELLRMAALQTLKPGVEKPAANVCKQPPQRPGYNQFPPVNRRMFSALSRGALRNGQFNGRKIRNTNLISIPTMESHINNDTTAAVNNERVIKLDLPQNRYYNKTNDDTDFTDSRKELSKFSRYDDDSDSDSEFSETEASESEDKLVRSQSLEALVQELEFEISGEKPAENKKAKVKRTKPETADDDKKLSDKEPDAVEAEKLDDAVDLFVEPLEDEPEVKEESTAEVATQEADVPTDCSSEHASSDKTDEVVVAKKADGESKPLPKSPLRGVGLLPKPRGFSPRYNLYAETASPPKSHMFQQQYHPQYAQPPPLHQLPLLRETYAPPPLPHYYPPANAPADRLLTLSPDAMTTITMAPLSPRSAAFVLQNREIIEKRKRSPRHSYSPSPPPPRTRRSKSPRRRSPSPRRYPRSTSPKRSSPHRKMRSPNKRRTRSPIERVSERSPKRDVKGRLTLNPIANKRERSGMSPPPAKQRREAAREDKDPVLEARRKKFEQQSTVSKEGVIRLKHNPDENAKLSPECKLKEEEHSQTPEMKDASDENKLEDDVVDEDTLQTNVEDLFSDDESEDENEGRFKSSNQARRSAPAIKFTSLNKLADIQNKSLEDGGREWSTRDRGRRDARRVDRGRERLRSDREPLRKHRSPLPADRKERSDKKDDRKETRRDEDALRRPRDVERRDDRKPSIKERLTLREKKEEKVDKTDRNDRNDKADKKDEKGRNGAEAGAGEKKAERKEGKLYASAHVVAVDLKTPRGRERSSSARKVAIAMNVKENKEYKPKDDITVIEDDDEQDVIKKNEAGDLRAQLSRKRAERQNQKPTLKVEDVQSRLLHNALGAVFQKSTRSKSKRGDIEAAPKEKLPIHQRLGLNDEMSMKKKKGKRTTEQV